MNTSTHEDASLSLYMQEVSQNPLLSAEEEATLAQQARKGNQRALDKLITANLRLVIANARRHQGRGVALADLINEGNLALVNAARRFDPSRGIRFASFAAWWVQYAIDDAIAAQGRAVSVPPAQLSEINRINKFKADFRQQNERQPNINEIAHATNKTELSVKKTMQGSIQQHSVDAPLTKHSPVTLLDRLTDSDAQPSDSLLLRHNAARQLHDAITHLTQREQNVVRAFYGIDHPQLTFAEIGERYGFSRERARQIRKKALRHMRAHTSMDKSL
jgi:RNA polymerase primary sigma factor